LFEGWAFVYERVTIQLLKFLANENIPISSVTYLQSLGYDIKAIGIDNPSITDKHVIEIVIEENRAVLTYDSDYGELIFNHGYKPNAGVIFIRIQLNNPLETAKILEQLTLSKDLSFERTLTVVDLNSIRQKKY